MTDKIYELIKQSEVSIGDIKCFTGHIDIDKFAELIVRECAELCDRFQARDVGMQPAECAGAIRKMFGIEE